MIRNLLKREFRFDLIAIIIIVFWGVIIYSNSFDAPFQFDDRAFVLANPAIKHLQNIHSIVNYRPQRWVAFFTFAANFAISGNNVFSYHLFNLILHLLNTILIYCFLNFILNLPSFKIDKFQNSKKIIPFFISLLFLVHPLQTESVTYIYQRFTPLATFFYLLTLIFYIKYRNGSLKSNYILCLLSLFLGMFSKEEMFTAPSMIILLEIYFISGFKVGKVGTEQCSVPTRWKMFIPILLTLLLIPLTYIFIVKGMTFNNINLNRISRDTFIFSRSTYLFTEFNVLIKYFQLFFFPIVLNLDYDFPISETLFEYPTILSFLIVLTLLIIGILLYKKHRLISFGIIWFFVTISITSSIIPIKDVIFEHRMYLPSIGLSIALIFALYQIFPGTVTKSPFLKSVNGSSSPLSKRVGGLLPILLIIIAIAFSFLTYRRNEVWRDDVRLWEDTAKKSPNKSRVHSNLANALVRAGKIDDAIKHYLEALRITPDYAEGYNNLGIALFRKGKIDEAIKYYNEALRLKPEYADAYNNLGNALQSQNKYDEAISYYKKAIQNNPNHSRAYNNLGDALMRQEKIDEAIDNYLKAVKLDPEYAECYNNLGLAFAKKNDINAAINYLSMAVQINPKHTKAHYNLAYYLYKAGNKDEAITHYSEVIKQTPGFVEAYNNLGLILTSQEKLEEANAYYSKAIKINPNYIQPYLNLTDNLVTSGEFDKAVANLSKASETNPNIADIYL